MGIVEVINLATQILTAVGTVGAVIISLWVTRQSKIIHANGMVTLSTIYMPTNLLSNTYQAVEEAIIITITNIGVKPFKIYNICVEDKLLKMQYIITTDYKNIHCMEPLHLFLESESGNYIFPKGAFFSSLKSHLGEIDSENVLKRLKKLKFFAVTNLSQTIHIKANKDFFNSFSKAFVSEK